MQLKASEILQGPAIIIAARKLMRNACTTGKTEDKYYNLLQ